MKQGTKKMLAYGVAAAAIYYFYRSTMSAGRETMQTLMPQSAPANAQGSSDPSLQLYGIGNPPNWY